MDPLADKLLVGAALIIFVELGYMPAWSVVIIISREFIVSGVRLIAADNGKVIALRRRCLLRKSGHLLL